MQPVPLPAEPGDELGPTAAGALERGLDFLVRAQLPDGELPSHRYRDPRLEHGRQLDPSPFVTSLIVHALEPLQHPGARALRERALEFLRRECEPPGIFRYWPRRSGRTIDPDLDDTCCAAFVLRRAGDLELGANEPLILANRSRQGMFKTWLRDPAAQNDVDSVVNANVLLYLGSRRETRPVIDALCGAIHAGHEAATTSYYLDPLALQHAVSRAFRHGVRELGGCRARVLARLDARMQGGAAPSEPLAVALAMGTALNFEAPRPEWFARALQSLLGSQQPDGSWPAAAFYRGPEPPAEPSVWWASECLTTAFCLEALSRARSPSEWLEPAYRALSG